MSITLPKPGALKPFLLKPKIPGAIMIGLMIAQYVFIGPGTKPDPTCTLNVEEIHESTHTQEYQGRQTIKLNITSKCNVPQKSTTLDARIDRILGVEQLTVRKFDKVVAEPMDVNRNNAYFLDLFIDCQKSAPILYSGFAKGEVKLANGQKILVAGNSQKFRAVPCAIKAK